MEPTDSISDHSEQQPQRQIHFPQGLPAFEQVKDFMIITNEEEAPFLWLQAANIPNLAFITIDPFLVMPSYRPDICDADVEALEIENPEDTFILGIVTIHKEPNGITCNLVSPVVINWKKQLGKQVILNNHKDYAVQYRIDNLPTDEEGNIVVDEEEASPQSGV